MHGEGIEAVYGEGREAVYGEGRDAAYAWLMRHWKMYNLRAANKILNLIGGQAALYGDQGTLRWTIRVRWTMCCMMVNVFYVALHRLIRGRV